MCHEERGHEEGQKKGQPEHASISNELYQGTQTEESQTLCEIDQWFLELNQNFEVIYAAIQILVREYYDEVEILLGHKILVLPLAP